MAEDKVLSPLIMDRGDPLGNSPDGTGRRALHVNNVNSLVPAAFDGIYVSYPSATVEIYAYKIGVTVVATITVTYTDATKADILSAVRT